MGVIMLKTGSKQVRLCVSFCFCASFRLKDRRTIRRKRPVPRNMRTPWKCYSTARRIAIRILGVKWPLR